MRVYITRANSMKILRKLDFSKMDLSGDVYNRPLFFLNKKEEQALLAYKEFVEARRWVAKHKFAFQQDLFKLIDNWGDKIR